MLSYDDFFNINKPGENPKYPYNDIGISRLFADVHRKTLLFALEENCWYCYNGKIWDNREGALHAKKVTKDFIEALKLYTEKNCNHLSDAISYVDKLMTYQRREILLKDAQTESRISIVEFDKDIFMLNCQNGTLNLKTCTLQTHNADDFITKITRAEYNPLAHSERWNQFLHEIMCSQKDLMDYLQEVFGYTLSGLTTYECFFILYGREARNGKGTLVETIRYLLKDYAVTVQPLTLSGQLANGSVPTPDIARIKDARLICVNESPKSITLNSAMVKQLTGGDSVTGRMLRKNPIEFKPHGKIIISTNHLPIITDDSLFASRRVKVIPFIRHFTEDEQDLGLKALFCSNLEMCAILNWLIKGWQRLQENGLADPPQVKNAIRKYRAKADVVGGFLAEHTIKSYNSKLRTPDLYRLYEEWAIANGFLPLLNTKAFVAELRDRFSVRKDSISNFVSDLSLLDDVKFPK